MVLVKFTPREAIFGHRSPNEEVRMGCSICRGPLKEVYIVTKKVLRARDALHIPKGMAFNAEPSFGRCQYCLQHSKGVGYALYELEGLSEVCRLIAMKLRCPAFEVFWSNWGCILEGRKNLKMSATKYTYCFATRTAPNSVSTRKGGGEKQKLNWLE